MCRALSNFTCCAGRSARTTCSTRRTRSGGAGSDFEAWTRSEAFRLAHHSAGQNRPLYLGHPEFEGFEVIQTVEAKGPVTARILVLGAGFAGLWSAVGAARALDEFRIGRDAVQVTVVNRDAVARDPRAELRARFKQVSGCALDDVLEPIGVERVTGEVVDIDFEQPPGHLLDPRRPHISWTMTGWCLPSAAVWSAPMFPGSQSSPSMSILTTAPRGSTPTSMPLARSRPRPGNILRSSSARV